MIYAARILYPVKVLGPGERIGIWFAGCDHRCAGCSNPELWEKAEKYQTTVEIIHDMICRIARNHPVDGFTLTGGDPLYQPEGLQELLPYLSSVSSDILMYTGYVYEDIKDRYADILKFVSVLIDGPYIEERNNNCPLRGSDNQRVLILQEELRNKYETYLSGYTNKIQNFPSKDGVISVGIHKRGYTGELQKALLRKGVLTNE